MKWTSLYETTILPYYIVYTFKCLYVIVFEFLEFVNILLYVSWYEEIKDLHRTGRLQNAIYWTQCNKIDPLLVGKSRKAFRDDILLYLNMDEGLKLRNSGSHQKQGKGKNADSFPQSLEKQVQSSHHKWQTPWF